MIKEATVRLVPRQAAGGMNGNRDSNESSSRGTPPKGKGEDERLRQMFAAVRFDYQKPVPTPPIVISLGKHAIATPGNLVVVQAQVKAGKSTVVAALLASSLRKNEGVGDTFGFVVNNPQGYAVIHLDTEQSRHQADQNVRRSIVRAEIKDKSLPEWFQSYSVVGFSHLELRRGLSLLMEDARRSFGGVCYVLIDGVADLAPSVLDETLAIEVTNELRNLAARFQCPILGVIHENPGKNKEGKTRGHLGSELERRAEANLRLYKDNDGITTIWSERSRTCYIPKRQGFCFRWDEERRMHVSCEEAARRKEAKQLRTALEEIGKVWPADKESFTNGDLENLIKTKLQLQRTAATNRIKLWTETLGLLKNENGLYRRDLE